MTRKQYDRMIDLICELSAMSRCWHKYQACDWQPLEDELKALQEILVRDRNQELEET